MSDPKLPRGPQKSIPVQLGRGKSSAGLKATEETGSLKEQLDATSAIEEEADLSTLDAEELAVEEQRQTLRERRDNHADARLANEEKRAKRREERLAQVLYRRLLVYAAVVATAVIVVGLCERETDFVRDGMICLWAVCGLGLYRLRPFGKGLKGS